MVFENKCYVIYYVIAICSFFVYVYEEISSLSAAKFKRLTGVKKEVFTTMLEVVDNYKQSIRKHASRGKPPKLINADKLLLLLMYYREYRSQFHISVTYGIS